MRDILLLVGLSGSGKDYLSKYLVKEKGFNNMVSYTTRPPRKGEQDGVEYHFIETNDEFYKLVEQGEIFETTEYNTVDGLWLYGYGRKSIPEKGKYKNVCILNPEGVRQFYESNIRDRICIVEAHSPTHLRLQFICERYGGLNNMTDKQMCEAFRREVEDSEPFYDYFDGHEDYSDLFNHTPYIEWNHNYEGIPNFLILRIEKMMEGDNV